MKLILTEKKDAAKMIAAALKVPSSDKGGYFEGKDIYITWAQGHLVETCPPEYYDESYRKWNLDDLPIIPDSLATRPMKSHRSKVGKIKGLISKSDTIINACDCGQEGEAIARLIFQHSGFKKPHKRLWFNSLLKDEIQRAFSDLKPSSDYDYLFDCASLRSFVDWTFGYNLTRAFTLKFGSDQVVNTGRVTTPTLTEIVERQLLIDGFKPVNFNVLVFIYEGFKYTSKKLDDSIISTKGFDSFTVTKSGKKPVTTKPPRLFSLNTLQKEANRIFSFKADKTLSVVEKLYLAGLVTYPRTDSEYLPETFGESDLLPLFKQHGHAVNINKSNKNIFNTPKVTDHHALIPTQNYKLIESDDENKIYNLILQRFFAAFSDPCLSISFSIEGVSNDVVFTASQSVITDPGFKTIYNFKSSESKEKEQDQTIDPDKVIIPDKDSSFSIDPSIDQRKTKPPSYYTDSTLITFMENAGKVIDEKLSSGIGTVATRAAIIKKLETQKFIAYQGKKISATDKAIKIILSIPFDSIKKPYLTLELEQLFDHIKRGSKSVSDCQNLSNQKLRSLFTEISAMKTAPRSSGCSPKSQETDLQCPICNKNLIASKFSIMCPNKDHNFSLPYSMCGKKLSNADHKALLSFKSTKVIKMISKKKKPFSASLSLNPDSFKIEFSFPK